jgi:hypothetical protein
MKNRHPAGSGQEAKSDLILPAKDAERFLKLLGKDPAKTWFRTLKPIPGKSSLPNVSRRGADLHGFDAAALEADNQAGSSIYFITGDADQATGKNKKTGNPTGCVEDTDIHTCCDVFVEWDDQTIEWQLTAWRELGLPEPTAMITTGGKSVHCYWQLREPMQPDAWKVLQRRLINYAGGDKSCKNPSRLMRVPGFFYVDKENGEVTSNRAELIHQADVTYTAEEIEACLPAPIPTPTKAVAAAPSREFEPRSDAELTAALWKVPQFEHDQGRREELLALAFRLAAEVGLERGLQLMQEHSPAVTDMADYFKALPDRINNGSIWPFLREKYGVDISRKESAKKKRVIKSKSQSIDSGEEDKKAELPFKVLGWCPQRKNIYYQHRDTGQVADIHVNNTAGTLLKLASLEWWQAAFRSAGRSEFNKDKALNSVIQLANKVGVFTHDRLRGRGVWMDGTQVVWHLGDCLEVNGQLVELIDRNSYHYQRLPRLPIDPATVPLTDAKGQQILEVVKAMGWAAPLDYLHLLGWVVLANVGGALDKRPVLQITCGFGKGKTHTIKVVIVPLLAGLAISQSNSTEAAIRQTLNTDTLPVVIDESEGEDQNKREGQLKLARLSFDGTVTSRGTTHGNALNYAVRSSIALVGINATIINPADRSRVVVVGRQQMPLDLWGEVDRKLQELLTVETGAQLLRRTVTHLVTLKANVATFRRVVEAQLPMGAAARAGDTYGALLAGAYLLVSTDKVDDAQALTWMDSIGWDAAAALGVDTATDQSSAAEGIQCLAKLLSHEEQWRSDTGTGKLSIRELVGLAINPGNSDESQQARIALGRRGIKTTDHALVIANSAEALAPIYANTKWRNGGHRQRLRDLPGAAATGAVHFKVLGSTKATTVPWNAVKF